MFQFLAGSLVFYLFISGVGRNAKLGFAMICMICLFAALFIDVPQTFRNSLLLTFSVMALFTVNLSGLAQNAGFTPLHKIAGLSYSIYVLHWPIITFWVLQNGDLGVAGRLVCAALTAIGSLVTYRFIETVFAQRKRTSGSAKDASRLIGLPIIVLLGACFYIIRSDGLAHRAAADVAQALQTFQINNSLFRGPKTIAEGEAPDEPASVRILTIGDSFAGDLAALIQTFPGYDTSVAVNLTYYCYGIILRRTDEKSDFCAEQAENLQHDFASADVILIVEMAPSQGLFEQVSESYEGVVARIRKTGYKGRIVIAGPRPIYSVQTYQAISRLDSLKEANAVLADELVLTIEQMNETSRQMSDWAQANNLEYLPIFPTLCNAKFCDVLNASDDLIYLDDTHLMVTATAMLDGLFRDVFLDRKRVSAVVNKRKDGIDYGALSDAELAVVPDKYTQIENAPFLEDADTADRFAEALMDELSERERDTLVRDKFAASSDPLSRQTSLFLAEKDLTRQESYSSRYLLGIAHWSGNDRPKRDTKVLDYWEHPLFKTAGVV